jgi:F-type H+-transporting ATPase subunit epsilon
VQVDVVSPERVVSTRDASRLIARTLDGELGILPGHAPLLGVLRPERVRIVDADGNEHGVAVGSGFIEVSGDRVVIISTPSEEEGRAP